MREKLIELIQSAVKGCATYWAGLIADYLIANGVTVQKRGRWELDYTCGGERLYGYCCDQCRAIHSEKSNYCPNCGAKMDGDSHAQPL